MTFARESEADAAIANMHKKDLKGCKCTVKKAKPRDGGSSFGGAGWPATALAVSR